MLRGAAILDGSRSWWYSELVAHKAGAYGTRCLVSAAPRNDDKYQMDSRTHASAIGQVSGESQADRSDLDGCHGAALASGISLSRGQ